MCDKAGRQASVSHGFPAEDAGCYIASQGLSPGNGVAFQGVDLEEESVSKLLTRNFFQIAG